MKKLLFSTLLLPLLLGSSLVQSQSGSSQFTADCNQMFAGLQKSFSSSELHQRLVNNLCSKGCRPNYSHGAWVRNNLAPEVINFIETYFKDAQTPLTSIESKNLSEFIDDILRGYQLKCIPTGNICNSYNAVTNFFSCLFNTIVEVQVNSANGPERHFIVDKCGELDKLFKSETWNNSLDSVMAKYAEWPGCSQIIYPTPLWYNGIMYRNDI